MDPHANKSISPYVLYRSLKNNHTLIFSLIVREIIGRYRGSFFGLLWSFFNPLLLLSVYTFVFGVIFQSHWGSREQPTANFSLLLFIGMIFFNLFSECVNRAPGLIIGNISYVKKVVFPLEVLPIVSLGSATFHMLISLCVWVVFYFLSVGLPHASILWLPILLFPLMMITLGLGWFLASLGVYFRDMSQIIGLLVTVLMFLSPVFYSIEAMPVAYRSYMEINPLTVIIEQARNIMYWNKGIEWTSWSGATSFSLVTAWLGFAWFQRTRKGFADVL